MKEGQGVGGNQRFPVGGTLGENAQECRSGPTKGTDYRALLLWRTGPYRPNMAGPTHVRGNRQNYWLFPPCTLPLAPLVGPTLLPYLHSGYWNHNDINVIIFQPYHELSSRFPIRNFLLILIICFGVLPAGYDMVIDRSKTLIFIAYKLFLFSLFLSIFWIVY